MVINLYSICTNCIERTVVFSTKESLIYTINTTSNPSMISSFKYKLQNSHLLLKGSKSLIFLNFHLFVSSNFFTSSEFVVICSFQI